MKITQVELVHKDRPDKITKMTIWLPSEEYTWTRGMRVELKDQPSIIWTVQNVYSTQDHSKILRRWNVGGL
jgi:hypothetical protein